MDQRRFLSLFNERNKIQLPGLEAQLRLAPPYREDLLKKAATAKKKAKQAAVLLCVYPNATGDLHFVLIRRNDYPGVHSGQIGFPGGKVEPMDASYWDTALRETEEEIGIHRLSVAQLLELSSLYIPPSNFMVRPFLGWCETKPQFQADAKEVATIIEIPLTSFLAAQPQKTTQLPSSTHGWSVEVPCYFFGEAAVWGATAMILSEFQYLMNKLLAT